MMIDACRAAKHAPRQRQLGQRRQIALHPRFTSSANEADLSCSQLAAHPGNACQQSKAIYSLARRVLEDRLKILLTQLEPLCQPNCVRADL